MAQMAASWFGGSFSDLKRCNCAVRPRSAAPRRMYVYVCDGTVSRQVG